MSDYELLDSIKNIFDILERYSEDDIEELLDIAKDYSTIKEYELILELIDRIGNK